MLRHCLAGLAGAIFLTSSAWAADIALVGVFPNKAVLVVDGANPKTYAIGEMIGNAKLVAVADNTAVIESGGKRQTLQVGSAAIKTMAASPSSASDDKDETAGGKQSVTLSAGSNGHFMTQGQINGGAVTFLVDTGASMVYMGMGDAVRLGVNLKKAQMGYSMTANGPVRVYRVMLDSVKVGPIKLYQVEASVSDANQPIVLLGMSFLNRMDMQRSGDAMTLTKRY